MLMVFQEGVANQSHVIPRAVVAILVLTLILVLTFYLYVYE